MSRNIVVRIAVVACVAGGLLAPTTEVAAQAPPPLVPFSGVVSSGAGTATVTLSIYAEASGGNALWSETQSVQVNAQGQFEALLGLTAASGLPAELFGDDETRWIGVSADGQAEGTRTLLTSVPYAMKAADANTLGGLPASAFALADGGSLASTAGASGASAPQVDGDGGAGEGGFSSTSGELVETSGDQVILDDLIVDGSACIGVDCVNGESFGFDTIRLKENNLRIKFDDTSTSASFPKNDWQLTANDSANGGLNKFSIDDITGGRTPFTVEAGAPSHSLYVDDGGRLGLGLNTPVVDVHVKSGNTPTLRLEQDGSSGFTPQTWDVAGNEANFFVRDATNGSKLPFKIKPGAATDAVYIDADGDVGIGTSSPNLADFGNADANLLIRDTGVARLGFRPDGTGAEWALVSGGTATNDSFIFASAATPGGVLALDDAGEATFSGLAGAGADVFVCASNLGVISASTTACSGSSINFKEDVRNLPLGLDTVLKLRPVTFEWKPGYRASEPTQIGFVAQEVEAVSPLLAQYRDGELHGVMYAEMTSLLVKAVQEQQAQIDDLREQTLVETVEEQRRQIEELKALVKQLVDAQ